jgi:hypothetical protein
MLGIAATFDERKAMTIKHRVDCIFQLLGQSGRWKQAVIQHFGEAIADSWHRPLFNERDEVEAGIEFNWEEENAIPC